MFTLACLSLSSIKYDTEHLMMLGSSFGCFPCRRCATNLDATGSRCLKSCALFPKLQRPSTNIYVAVGAKKGSPTPDGEKLRGKNEVVIGGGLILHSILANICQTRLRSDCGAVRVCLHCCCSMTEDTVRINSSHLAPSFYGIRLCSSLVYSICQLCT